MAAAFVLGQGSEGGSEVGQGGPGGKFQHQLPAAAEAFRQQLPPGQLGNGGQAICGLFQDSTSMPRIQLAQAA